MNPKAIVMSGVLTTFVAATAFAHGNARGSALPGLSYRAKLYGRTVGPWTIWPML